MNRGELLAAMEAVKGCIPAKPHNPILKNVLIAGRTVLGFDTEIGVKVTMPTETGLPPFNLPFDPFHQLLRNLEGEDVSLKVEGKRVYIEAGRHKSVMAQIVEEEFPKPEVILGEMPWCTVPAGFKEGLERALLSASTEESNRLLSAILVKGTRIYGCNGHQCSRCTLPELKVTTPMLLSRKAVEEITRLGNPSRLVVAGSWAVFDYTNLTFLARMREGADQYPAIDPVYDKLGDIEIQDVPPNLIGVLHRLRTVDNSIKIEKSAMMGTRLSTSGDRGSAEEYIDAQPLLTFTKGFNAAYMLAGLDFASKMNWGAGPDVPIYLNGEHAGFEYLVMPTFLGKEG